MNYKKWSLKDVILLALLAFLFGAVLMGGGFIYIIIEAMLLPLGLQPFANEILFGVWTMAAPVIAMIIRRPFSALLGEVFAALAEMLYGSYFGAGVLISGLIQGLGSELGFTLTKYKRYDYLSLSLAALFTTVFSFIYEIFKLGYFHYNITMILALFVVRLLSVMFFNVLLVGLIMKLYSKFIPAEVNQDA